MFSWRKFSGGLIAIAALSACASVATRLPDISASAMLEETQTQETLALTEYNAQAKTFLSTAYPVLLKNESLCPKTRAGIGIWTHSISDYDKRLRLASERVLGAEETPRIFQIASGSPAAAAGLKIGDEVLDADGEALAGTDKVLREQYKAGEPLSLSVRRNGNDMSISVTPRKQCAYNLRLRISSVVNAYADGRNITFTTGMLDFTESEDELALIIGHELAHNTMGHIRKVISNIILSGGATRYTRPFESEADYVGLYYQVRAGYSPDNVEDFWRRLAKVNPKYVGKAKTHPTFPDRYLRIAATRVEIKAKQAAGERLVPNFKKAQPDAETGQ